MTYRTDPVPLPADGRFHILNKKYVYWYNSASWNKEKRVMQDNRVLIGRLVPGKADQMYPNERYKKIFVQKDRDSVMERPKKIARVLSYGGWLALNESANNVGLIKALKTHFPQRWREILALSYYLISSQGSTAQLFSYWSFTHYCGLSKIFCSSAISDLYRQIGLDGGAIEAFLSDYQHNYFQWKSALSLPNQTLLSFDSTNQNTASQSITMAEFGHAKIKENLPDVNTAMFVDELTGIPLFYEHFYGSILDKSQTPFTLEKARNLGFQKLFLVMDRGYCSRAAINKLKDMTFSVMCPESLTLVSSLITTYSEKIINREAFYISQEDAYGIHIPNTEVYGLKLDAYVFYDPQRAQAERNSIHGKIRLLKKLALDRSRFTQKLVKQFDPWLMISKTSEKDAKGRNFTAEPNVSKIQKVLDQAGLFVVLSNSGLPTDDLLRIARMRDKGEKCFRRLKWQLDMTKTYCHGLDTYEGKMFVAFVALVLAEAFRWAQRELLGRITSTTATAIGELEKYQVMRKEDQTWMPVYAMTKKQKELFGSLGLSEPTVISKARQLFLQV